MCVCNQDITEIIVVLILIFLPQLSLLGTCWIFLFRPSISHCPVSDTHRHGMKHCELTFFLSFLPANSAKCSQLSAPKCSTGQDPVVQWTWGSRRCRLNSHVCFFPCGVFFWEDLAKWLSLGVKTWIKAKRDLLEQVWPDNISLPRPFAGLKSQYFK